jgi:hypothetical protein
MFDLYSYIYLDATDHEDIETKERLVTPGSAVENNHEATELQQVDTDHEKEGDEDKGKSSFKVKERSILQAKLTKLAIQIGYAG